MRLGKGAKHLSFCMNIFPGESLEALTQVISNECVQIKSQICPDEDFGLGLRLSAESAAELRDLTKLKALKDLLTERGLYAFTVNAFPFGNFHVAPVKEKVYFPDWSSSERLKYTCDVAEALAYLLPEDSVLGSISTVPVTFGKVLPSGAIDNLRQCAQYLADLECRTGKHIELALEPEPDCYLETCDETIDFFELLSDQIDAALMTYLGVCVDTCHGALQFEDATESLQTYIDAEINISKIQLSSAIILDHEKPGDEALMFPFEEKVYLHQTRVMNAKNEVKAFKDLPEALKASTKGEWRTHFHVPLHFEGEGKLRSTFKLIDQSFFDLALQYCDHIETETYTYLVLPEPRQEITACIVDELVLAKSLLS
jgi:sugar phosphate isomerase/epimerase